jgi:chromosomal replication initiation ATPase DnaA|tara:strand:- start:1028 stop:1687 length:660 start_codon:yes stop_codon:yes gene_type:complete
MNDQLILKFPSEQAYKKEDFYVSSGNQEAYDFINLWPKWIKRIINIYGPTGSGKSHLAFMLESKTSCIKINSDEIKDNIFLQFKTREALIIENLKENVSEKLLFSLWNVALQDNKYILITSKKPISSYHFKMKDLMSRINSSLFIGINLASDDLISVILAKNFSDKQIKVEKKHIDYIVKRIDRSYEKISQFILISDKYSLKKGSPFDLKLIKEVLKML